MDPEEFANQQREVAMAMVRDVQRVMRTDADIMEAVRDMVGAARDEVGRNPRLAFGSGASRPSSVHGEPLVGEEELGGGQGTPQQLLLKEIFELVKEEKQLIKDVILRLLG